MIGAPDRPMPSVEKKLTVWGIVSALGSGLFILIPGVNALAALATIAVSTLVVARLGFARGMLVTFPGIVLAAAIGSLTMGYQAGWQLAAAYALAVICPALMMGWAARRLASPMMTVLSGLLPIGVIFALFLSLYSRLMSDPTILLDQLNSDMIIYAHKSPEFMSLIQKAFPPSDGALDRFIEAGNSILVEFLKVLPGVIALGCIGAILCGSLIAGAGAAKFGIIFPRFRPFYMWRASGWWLLLTILGLIPVVFFEKKLWFYAGVNVLIVTGHVYMIVGFSVMESYFHRLHNPGRIRLAFYGALLLLGAFAFAHPLLFYAGLMAIVFLTALGLADSRFDFRKETLEVNND